MYKELSAMNGNIWINVDERRTVPIESVKPSTDGKVVKVLDIFFPRFGHQLGEIYAFQLCFVLLSISIASPPNLIQTLGLKSVGQVFYIGSSILVRVVS